MINGISCRHIFHLLCSFCCLGLSLLRSVSLSVFVKTVYQGGAMEFEPLLSIHAICHIYTWIYYLSHTLIIFAPPPLPSFLWEFFRPESLVCSECIKELGAWRKHH
jgi:hypothetical protein